MTDEREGPELVPDPYFEDRRHWTRWRGNSTDREERAAIVAWLRDQGEGGRVYDCETLAAAVERGEHLDRGGK